MTFADVVDWFRARQGRELHLVVYAADVPVVALDGPLGAGVEQARSVLRPGRLTAPPLVFELGGATFGLDEALFRSAQEVGRSVAVRLADDVEVVAHAWNEP